MVFTSVFCVEVWTLVPSVPMPKKVRLLIVVGILEISPTASSNKLSSENPSDSNPLDTASGFIVTDSGFTLFTAGDGESETDLSSVR